MKHALIRATPAIVIDRRTTLRWFAAALTAGPLAACGESPSGLSWAVPEPLTGAGYGRDPTMLEPNYPWPLTLSGSELRTLTTLVDLILPADGSASAASQVGVPAFINEWVSAPYPDQQRDRALVLPGLAWLDAEARGRQSRSFSEAEVSAQTSILDDVAFKDRVKPGFEKPAEFFGRMRALTMGAYYTSEEGWKEIGYLGNQPANGDYAGPTHEAIEHLKSVLAGMGLTFNPAFDPL